MTIRQIIPTYSAKLKSSSPVLDIEILLAKTLNKNKEYLYTYPDKKLTAKKSATFKKLFNRRNNGEPVAYILGYQEFFNLNFKVDPRVLIPRPETEILVEEVIKYYKSKIQDLKSKICIADIGAGSGAIIIALAKNIKKAEFWGAEISKKALQIAKQNAKLHQVKIKFLKGNLLDPLQSVICDPQSDSIITANLPYLTSQELKNPNLKYEPQIALKGGADGLKLFQTFFNQIQKFKLQPQSIFLEIGHKQAAAIKKLARHALPNYKFKVVKDLCGFDRLVIISK
ncbi:MAG TPA: peptide chain release factor N(5)-glutamine methyltransferase [Candidatus Uhrbacteria bacterium]|nr:peptide chain release factor N(5)-glutamine methyltransferase [Candidatus Uhrbacteria bacterium]